MKVIKSQETVDIPPGVKVIVRSRRVLVKGRRGSLTRSFRHLAVDIKAIGKKVVCTKYFGIRKEIAALRTICTHIGNMIKGVTYGYRYKLKSVYAHFPINLVILKGGELLEIRNFLGEKNNRLVKMKPGVKVSSTGLKDEIQLESNDIELVSKCGKCDLFLYLVAALVQQSCKVRHKDIRKFLDGVYVSERSTVESMD